MQLFHSAETHHRRSSWCLHRGNRATSGVTDISFTRSRDEWAQRGLEKAKLVYRVWYSWWTSCEIFIEGLDQNGQESRSNSLHCRFFLLAINFCLSLYLNTVSLLKKTQKQILRYCLQPYFDIVCCDCSEICILVPFQYSNGIQASHFPIIRNSFRLLTDSSATTVFWYSPISRSHCANDWNHSNGSHTLWICSLLSRWALNLHDFVLLSIKPNGGSFVWGQNHHYISQILLLCLDF